MAEQPADVVQALSRHLDNLKALHDELASDGYQLTIAAEAEINDALVKIFQAQVTDANDKLGQAREALEQSWKRISDWRNALGEPALKRPKNSDPLDLQLKEADKYLDGMKARMKERGETIVSLQRKLSTMQDVLGLDWMQVKLEPEWQNGWEGLDLRLERMAALEREVVRAEGELARRRKQLASDIREVLAVRAELGISQQGDDFDTFDDAILAHEGAAGRQKKELSPTIENLERVAARRTWLEGEKEARNSKIQATYDKLYPLWEMLGVSSDEMDSFVNKWCGSTLDVVQAYQDELNRMLSLRRTNLSAFIQHERDLLTGLYDALYLSEDERLAMFPQLGVSIESELVVDPSTGREEVQVNDNVSEDLLTAHEQEKVRVEVMVESAKDVLTKLARYFDILEEVRELEASAADPNRLLGKATRGDPGRLLREEKARKRIAKEKPKLETELRFIIPQWEMENDRAFTVNGSRFIDDLEARIEAEEATRKKPKGSSIPPTKPLKAQATGGSTISSKTAPGSVVPLKRHMTGSSSASAASSKPAPAKRQAPMTTGGRTAMHDIANTTQATPTPFGKSVVAQHTGMRIPAGFGSSNLQTPIARSYR